MRYSKFLDFGDLEEFISTKLIRCILCWPQSCSNYFLNISLNFHHWKMGYWDSLESDYFDQIIWNHLILTATIWYWLQESFLQISSHSDHSYMSHINFYEGVILGSSITLNFSQKQINLKKNRMANHTPEAATRAVL